MGSIYVKDPAPDNRALDLTGQPSLSSDWATGTAFDEAWYYNPMVSGLRHQEQTEAAAGTAMPDTGPVLNPDDPFRPNLPTASPVLDQKEVNELYGIPGELHFDRPTRKAEAELLSRWKRDELKRANVLSRATPGVLPNLARLGVGFLATAVDPLNVASAFIPVVGEARFAALAGRLGKTGARLVKGGAEGAVGAAVVEPVILLQAQSQQADYDAYDSLLNLAFGTVLGGGLHAGFGKLSDMIARQPIEVRETALRGAVAAVAEDRPVMVAEGITAFHGSPHLFDRFSLQRIGTGEGAAAFGHGLYFAERREVAEGYKVAGQPAYRGQAAFDRANAAWKVAQEQALPEDEARLFAISLLNDQANAAPPHERQLYYDAANNFDELTKGGTGGLYETRLRVSKDDLLDWDKPLSEQSEKVREALKKSGAFDALRKSIEDGNTTVEFGKATGGDLVEALRPYTKDWGKGGRGDAEVSAMLREAGIPGIKYLDQGSRADGEGTRNFVIFDDSLIDIVARNDQPFDARAAAAAQAKSNEMQPADAEQIANIDRLSEGFDQPITPDTGAEEAAELIEATNEAYQMAKREGVLTDADEAAIKGDPEAEKATKEIAAGREALVSCLVRAA